MDFFASETSLEQGEMNRPQADLRKFRKGVGTMRAFCTVMLTFAYQARDASGKTISGVQEALNEDNAINTLMSRGLTSTLLISLLGPLLIDASVRLSAQQSYRHQPHSRRSG